MRYHVLLTTCLMLGSAPVVVAHDGLDEQIIALSEQLARDPHDGGLLLKRSELYRLHGEFTLALADIARARASGTVNKGIDRCLARVLFDQHKFTEAFQAFSRHLSQNPQDGDALAMRARCAMGLGDSATAIADLEAACRLLHQPDPDLLSQMAELLHAAGRTDEALARLESAITRDGDIPVYHERALAIERADQRHAAAIKRLEHLAAGGQLRWQVELGDLLAELNRQDQAIAIYRAAAQTLASLPSSRRQVAANLALSQRIEAGLARAPTTTHAK